MLSNRGIEEVRIRNLGVIEDAVLELSRGFNVVTGETGAGKTMVVTSLGLLFGERADPQRVRPGADKADVEGRIAVGTEGVVAQRVTDVGGELDDDVVIVARSVSAEGRSRAQLGGRSVPVSTLINLADDLVAVHGQSDQQRLLQPSRQRAALDRYAGKEIDKPLRSYTAAHRRFREVADLLTEITTRSRERAQEADLLRFGLEEIEKADPKPGEEDELAAEDQRLAHADALRSAATTAHEALQGDPGAAVDGADVIGLLGAARQALEGVRAHDSGLAAQADRLTEAVYLVSDVAAELAGYAESVEADPARLAVVQDRRAVLTALGRKYGKDVLGWAATAVERLADLDVDDEHIAELHAEQEDLHGHLTELAGELTSIRRQAAERLSGAITAELTALAMPHARVVVAVTSAGEDFGPYGVDDVELRLAAHPGAPPLPLQKGASGGELSRIMLAIEVVFAGADPVPTFVFDEVDAGVGGKAAVEVGRRLARLARVAQVIVVTHLPQVAAFADRHLVVQKAHDGIVTRSGVTVLDEGGRVVELSRMLAGFEDSRSAQAHAEELLAVAAKERES
jgi:DNA repair protein RecN (Recombination protein N)